VDGVVRAIELTCACGEVTVLELDFAGGPADPDLFIPDSITPDPGDPDPGDPGRVAPKPPAGAADATKDTR
jgi:hypothetical protein